MRDSSQDIQSPADQLSAHPSAQPGAPVTAFRALFFSAALIFLNNAVAADLSPIAIAVAALLGSALGLRAAQPTATPQLATSQLSVRGFFVCLAAAALIWWLLRSIGDSINPGASSERIFSWYLLSRSGELYLAILAVLATFEFLYRRTAAWLTLEIIGASALAVYAISSHYQFRLDSPRPIAELAWNFNSNPIGVFVFVGALLTLAITLFAAVCRRSMAPVTHKRTRLEISGGVLMLTLLVAFISYGAFSITSVDAGARLMNGVGQSKEPGVSPLSFQSALGATNQPAALVRLESDYPDNPFTPMLYLREDALSEFNGREMVHAVGAYDTDVINSSPDQPYKANPDDSSPNRLGDRRSVPHSVFLLADHKVPFAIDVPMALVPLKNPNPSKFKGGSYRIYSQAPIYKLEEIRSLPVGDPNWDAIERAHYLKTNPDTRYGERALEITANASSPIERAFALSQYLSAKSIYTLQPNHPPTKGDETAPYLFGDLRGYCVHFAHAMVYMLRSLDIPARIGTGYLTDLSQAKDGHILLRMSDRHAWAEVFVTGKGWVPFDVQPEQVESHGDSEVDMKLLDELMSQIDPGEEILPEQPSTPEKGLKEPSASDIRELLPSVQALAILLGGSLLALIATRLVLKHLLWRLPLDPSTRVALAYRAEVLAAAERGLARRAGETREEFAERVRRVANTEALIFTGPLLRSRYGKLEPVVSEQSPRVWLPMRWWQRTLALFSLSSLRRFFQP